ncbi:MAG: hypothetical protein B5M56_00350 [Desulfococcus sp. 4484_241]|nr:MAG: hypothetical protein B5M56_00350 [Desulfococcus sp. 4484_241]
MNDTSHTGFIANDFRFVESREEITIIFGAGEPKDIGAGAELVIDKASQIIFTPAAAKRFALLLKKMIARHESIYGVIGDSPFDNFGTGSIQGPGNLSVGHRPLKSGERLLSLVDDLGVEYGLEYSFKIFPGVILDDRFLVALNRKSLSGNAADKLLHLCRQIDMPERFEKIYFENLTDANILLFGYEGNEASGTYKVYLEFGSMFDMVIKEISGAPVSFLIHLGFKWDVEDNRRAALTRYTCYPTFSVEEILNRIRDRFYAGDKTAASYEIVRGIVERAARSRDPEDDFLYVEAKEENNPRQSYDINLYRANLTLEELYPWLREACRIKEISLESFHQVYEPMKKKIFGHVSGGFDRAGRDFFTFYYGLKGSTR